MRSRSKLRASTSLRPSSGWWPTAKGSCEEWLRGARPSRGSCGMPSLKRLSPRRSGERRRARMTAQLEWCKREDVPPSLGASFTSLDGRIWWMRTGRTLTVAPSACSLFVRSALDHATSFRRSMTSLQQRTRMTSMAKQPTTTRVVLNEGLTTAHLNQALGPAPVSPTGQKGLTSVHLPQALGPSTPAPSPAPAPTTGTPAPAATKP
jgi:hypothetical protein